MKLSFNWLTDFIDLKETDPQKIADMVTVCVAEVDAVEEQGALLGKCVLGKVLTLSKHPKADRLFLADVQTDAGTKRVVCGGTNLQEGMYVAFAHTGARVKWHGGEIVTLESATIRGEASDGMICAAEELEIDGLFPTKEADGQRPIVQLTATDKDIGKPLQAFLGLDDVIMHIDNHAITNRPDLFSHMGFARELVALGLATWKKQKKESVISFGSKPVPFQTKIDVPKLVPRYCACLLEIESLGETPDWMKKRLAAVGLRSVSLPVDITNYVTSETGMPLHSFDADDVHGDIHIRTSKKGEKLITLDKQERVLPDGALVLSDDDGLFDLLGIMGGLRSSTKSTTKHIYLHSAALDPISIRKAILATNHRTDASTIYEKGVPKVIVEEGFLRALELFLELVPGTKIMSEKETVGDNGSAEPIMLDPAHVTRLLGVEIPEKTMMSILEDLGFTIQKDTTSVWKVTPPLWRLNDCTIPQDLVEEIGRMYGYNKIESIMPIADVRIPDRDERVKNLRAALAMHGYTELVPLSLTSAAILKQSGLDATDALALQNPLGEELKYLQTSTLPGLLEQAAKNVRMSHQLKSFHCAHVFHQSKPEHLELGILLSVKNDAESLLQSPLLLLKQDVMHVLKKFGFDPEIMSTISVTASMHPGRSAVIKIDGKEVGTLFEVHPQVTHAFDLPGRAAAAVMDMTKLLQTQTTAKRVEPLPQYPEVSYDVTKTFKQTQEVGPLLSSLKQSDPLLEQAAVIDLFAGKPLDAGAYNLTVRFTYRAPDRTLTEAEAQAVHVRVLQKFA